MKPRRLLHTALPLTALAVLAAVCPQARAAEHITLRNGFEFDCLHHEPAGDRIRLYLIPSAPAGAPTQADAGYIEVSAASVLRVDIVPDPPPSPAASSLSSQSALLLSSRSAHLLSSQSALLLSSRSAHLLSSQSALLLSSRSALLLSSRSAAEGSASPPTPADIPQLLARAGTQHNIDTDLLASIVHAESNGNPRAVSRAGAQGLMQLMPSTASTLNVHNAFAADQNISGGTTYLDQLLTRYHDDLRLAVAAYNAGPAAVDRYHGIPPYAETRAYVARVVREFNRRKLASAAASVPAASRPVSHPTTIAAN
jgi:soluble lytic murein transglycosylase-like protein